MLHDPRMFGRFAKEIAQVLVAVTRMTGPFLGRSRVTLLVALLIIGVLGFSGFLVWNAERAVVMLLETALKAVSLHQDGMGRSSTTVLVVGVIGSGVLFLAVAWGLLTRRHRKARNQIVVRIRRPAKRSAPGNGSGKDRPDAA